ncbi:MAG: D-amino-acid transaminase [Alphaproteobacteria bacterium]|nr:D-amino-acid transaminase [Alphaproteobacteria bacterium]
MPSARWAYVNGQYVPHALARIHVEDRGLQFADSVYEVCAIVDGLMMDEEEHLDRLERSLRELAIPMPMGRAPLKLVLREMVRRNALRHGLIYLQVTRGTARRDHAAPSDLRPSLILTARPVDPVLLERRRQLGVKAISHPDERWARCDIKSTALLPNTLAKTAARRQGAFEAILVDGDGYVTEGASTNVWIVTKDGEIVTRNLSHNILPGVTRRVILEAAAEAQMRISERKFTLEEAKSAREIFLTAATLGATSVVELDGRPIGNQRPGQISQRIQTLYADLAGRRAVRLLPSSN